MSRLASILSRFSGDCLVRPARPEELPICAALAMNMMEDGELPITEDALPLIEDQLAPVIAGNESAVLVAVRDGRIVGQICVGVSPPDPWANVPTGIVWMLYVRPGFRMNRVALMLCKGAREWLLMRSVKRVKTLLDPTAKKRTENYAKAFQMTHESTLEIYSFDL